MILLNFGALPSSPPDNEQPFAVFAVAVRSLSRTLFYRSGIRSGFSER